MTSEEQAPLLSNVPPPQENTAAVPAYIDVTPSEPTASRDGSSNFQTINCQVCNTPVPLDGKTAQHVVKCGQCSEATPIKAAPPGKKYVRCPCNCLLICKATSARIACPRPHCKRVITLNYTGNERATLDADAPGQPGSVGFAPGPGQVQCLCGHCGCPYNIQLSTQVQSSGGASARCPHCRRVSSVGPVWARRRAIFHWIVALLFLVGAILVTATTLKNAQSSSWYYVLWAALYVIAVLLGIRGGMYFSMKVSVVESRAGGDVIG